VSNVQECIDLYLTDEEVSDAQFRAVIKDAYERDQQERITYWHNLLEARRERERLDNLEGK
jgi:hypothetical protein